MNYDQFVEDTCTYRDDIYPVLGLAGETGEFVELVKKAWRDHNELWAEHVNQDKVISELGDIIWYITRIAHRFGWSLDTVLKYNQQKLEDRRENGKKDNDKPAPSPEV